MIPPCRPSTAEQRSILSRIVTEVASVRDSPPTVSRPLYEDVDPDALERLVRSSAGTALEVRFEYGGCRVTIDADGRVSAAPRTERDGGDSRD